MSTVATSALADALAPPGNPPIARQPSVGHLYVAMRTATDTISIIRSTDSGASWSSTWGPGAVTVTFTHTGMQEWSKIVVDSNNGLHIAYRVGTGSADTIWYRRLATNTGAWSPALQVSRTDANGGVIGSVWQGVDLAVAKNSDKSMTVVVVGAYNLGTTKYGVYAMGLSVSPTGGTLTLNNGLISGTRVWYSNTGTPPGRSGVSAEVESNGDGITSGTPNVWVTWGRASVNMVKLAYQGDRVGWQGPTSAKVIRSTLPTAVDYVVGRYDGTRYMMGVPSPDDGTMVRVYQRNQANTSTTTLDTPAHPTGTIKNVALSYDNSSKNLRVFAVGTSTAVLYYVDYVRLTSTWTSWATVVATAISSSYEWGVRAGGSSVLARHDVVTLAGSTNPWTATHTTQSVSTAPAVSSFVTTAQAYANGGPANVGGTLPLAWTFSDQDPGQTQGYYALSRQIGSATVAYWNAGTLSWGASETQNTSSTQGVTLPTAWGLDSDLPHTYKVKVWDNAGTVAPGYSAALILNPSAQVNPTVSAPGAGSTLTSDTQTVTWTVAEQTGIRVVLSQTSPVAKVVLDTGAMMGYTDTSYAIPVSLANGTAWSVTLYAFNNEQLQSAGQTRAFSVAYAPPPSVVPSLLAQPLLGYVALTPTALSPVGTQPAIVSQDVYRRVRTATAMNANTDVTGSTTGFSGSGGTLTYSTTQSRSSPGAARLVPDGVSAAALVLSSSFDVSAGIAAGKQYTAGGWVRPDTANKSIRIQVSIYNSSSTFLTSLGQTIPGVVAGAWVYVEFTADPSTVATAARVAVGIGLTGTPAAGDAYYADDIVLREANSDTGVRIATGADITTVINDSGATSRTDYEWRSVTKGANGTTQTGPWIG